MLFEIGRQIRQARKDRRLTQAALAAALGISRATISQLERGTVQDIGIRKVMRLLDYLGLALRVGPKGRPPTLDELREEHDA
ncbi:MAG TPA: helix-turn-helix transcriptional regulator [Armatimonadota bacterium]|nr:helix-turn-helix transcriptional regulator [Armatimonadota bacterium]